MAYTAMAVLAASAIAQVDKTVIRSGVAWFDTAGDRMYAGGANLYFENGVYYLVGEGQKVHADCSECFNLYSSKDLGNWTFEVGSLIELRNSINIPSTVTPIVLGLRSEKRRHRRSAAWYSLLSHGAAQNSPLVRESIVKFNAAPCVGGTFYASVRFVQPSNSKVCDVVPLRHSWVFNALSWCLDC